MFLKGLAIIVFIVGIAVVLLGMRQERLTSMHEMAQLHAKMNRSRQAMWDMQVRVAGKTSPEALAEAVQRAKLQLEPATPGAAAALARPANVRHVQVQND
ncbi:MAG: hypothetical protein IT444_12275 [Phycisphaeraceae bacterium]|nr:hypothetical protein [Phycisphaeraceae bacterium]